mmetsp:Transcript_35925/g.55171  ORF Transcript_35925/g.55171 Transcript_35925/m.55171 type:complete len:221 (+) Transcript_35925:939-1601(+)
MTTIVASSSASLGCSWSVSEHASSEPSFESWRIILRIIAASRVLVIAVVLVVVPMTVVAISTLGPSVIALVIVVSGLLVVVEGVRVGALGVVFEVAGEADAQLFGTKVAVVHLFLGFLAVLLFEILDKGTAGRLVVPLNYFDLHQLPVHAEVGLENLFIGFKANITDKEFHLAIVDFMLGVPLLLVEFFLFFLLVFVLLFLGGLLGGNAEGIPHVGDDLL